MSTVHVISALDASLRAIEILEALPRHYEDYEAALERGDKFMAAEIWRRIEASVRHVRGVKKQIAEVLGRRNPSKTQGKYPEPLYVPAPKTEQPQKARFKGYSAPALEVGVPSSYIEGLDLPYAMNGRRRKPRGR